MTLAIQTGRRQEQMQATPSAPPLENGDRLSRDEFEARYTAHPEIKRAELIDGVVYVSSPAGPSHSVPHARVFKWLFYYEDATPGILIDDNVSLRLDGANEVQPDAMVRLSPECGGQVREARDAEMLEGRPELVVEVAASSVAYDLGAKAEAYRRSGIPEYLVLTAYERETHWFALDGGLYRPIPADAEGRIRSRVLPGLWLDPAAFWDYDKRRLRAAVAAGLASSEHAEFVAELQRRSASSNQD